jgi:hypothetical protein
MGHWTRELQELPRYEQVPGPQDQPDHDPGELPEDVADLEAAMTIAIASSHRPGVVLQQLEPAGDRVGKRIAMNTASWTETSSAVMRAATAAVR